MSTITATLTTRRSQGITATRLIKRRLLPSLELTSRSLHLSPETSEPPSDVRPILSVRHYHVPRNASIPRMNPSPTTYSALRNKASMPFDLEEGKDYVSPYADFFANIEAGRSALGTTVEMDRRVFEMKEQYLKCGVPESALRFQTVSYGRFVLPPYVSPGEHRVTVKLPLSAIPFINVSEKEIFLQIVGSRYDKSKDQLQLSSEKFASRIENKRHLVGMIEQIVSNSRRLAKEFQEEDDDYLSGGKISE